MTYDQWKTTDPRDYEPEPEEGPTELETMYEALHEVQEQAKWEREVAARRIRELQAALEEALGYFREQYVDVVDGDQLPSKGMRIRLMIDEVLYGIRF